MLKNGSAATIKYMNYKGKIMVKQCELCHSRPATIPDRNRMGRPINRICNECHMARLRGDMEYILHNIKENKK